MDEDTLDDNLILIGGNSMTLSGEVSTFWYFIDFFILFIYLFIYFVNLSTVIS